jgi:hypothetical protein
LSEIAKEDSVFIKEMVLRLLEKNYLQPSYGEGKYSLHLFLMANFLPENLENSIQEIYAVVYQKAD